MKKFDWNVPMTRKNWAWLYVGSFGLIAVFYALLWVWGTISAKKNRVVEPVQEDDSDDEPYFDDEE